jgi:hypothetical protein
VLVVLFASSAEASHFHNDLQPSQPLSKPLSKKTSGTCLLCSGLHAPALSALVLVFGITIATSAEAIPTVRENFTRLKDFGLFVRPPPTLA